MKKKILAAALAAISVMAGTNMNVYADWQCDFEKDRSWYYVDARGKRVTGLQQISDNWYYFDEDGVRQTGWVDISGNWYYFNDNGTMYTGWLEDNSNYYYFNQSGIMQKGLQKISGKWFYFDESGVQKNGWQQINGKWYYFYNEMLTGWLAEQNPSTGYPILRSEDSHNGSVEYLLTGFNEYYLFPDGHMATGTQNIDGYSYTFNSAGVLQLPLKNKTGWNKVGNRWYYTQTPGRVYCGWQKIDGKWYCFDQVGVMQTGWEPYNADRYYLDASGILASGWRNISGKWYYFHTKYSSEYLAEYPYAEENYPYQIMWTGWLSSGQNWYYLRSTGEMAVGWENIKGKDYYFLSDGRMATGEQIIAGKTYVFNTDGSLQPEYQNLLDTNKKSNPSIQALTAGQKTISAGDSYTLAVDNNQKVKFEGAYSALGFGGEKPEMLDPNIITNWRNIIAIDAEDNHTLGLKSDGTVVETAFFPKNIAGTAHWKDIVAISAGMRTAFGLKKDGTVVSAGCDAATQEAINHWSDIVFIKAVGEGAIGIKSDKTVTLAIPNCPGRVRYELSTWTDVVAIDCEDAHHIVGLKSDGTVLTTCEDDKEDIKTWKNIVDIAVSYNHIVGLKADGTVVAVGDYLNNTSNVDGWTDIVAVAAGFHTVGLKSDGTMVATGNNNYGQCNVNFLENIKQPK